MQDISVSTHMKSLVPDLDKVQTNADSGFIDMLASAIDETNQIQLNADKAVTDLSTGRADNIHEVMLSMEEADISMRMLVQMRNKVVEAYKEIMNMQV
jgi:flagellar hook-basal body complex protein FliE